MHRTVPFKVLLVKLAYELANGPLQTLRRHIGLEKYATQCCKSTVSVEVLLGLKSDVHFSLRGHSLSRNFSSKGQHTFEKIKQYVHGLVFFNFSLLNII